MSSINHKYPILECFDTYPEYGDKNYSVKNGFLAKRNKAWQRRVNPNDRLKSGIGAVAGTLAGTIYLKNKQNVKGLLSVKYGLGDMVLLSGASIVGGVGLGMLGEDKQTRNNKFKEGFFQFLNASLPAWVVAGAIKLCETSKNFNNIPGKIMSSIGGLVVGMYGAAALANVISDPQDKYPDRKLNLTDCLVNIDDAIGVLVLSKFPLVDKLQVEKLLPFVYAYCGYRAGKSN